MRRDARPYWMFRARKAYDRWWTRRRLAPHFDALGPWARVENPWRVEVTGRNIRAGRALHILADRYAPVRITTWPAPDSEAEIVIGDAVLLIAGARIMAAERVEIGSGTMLAANVTISDSDWHGLYDRVGPPAARPVTIGRNVWIGDGAFIGKGVSIGDDAIIGARSVVVRDAPAGTVAAGNPAAVVKSLDPDAPRRTRLDLLDDPAALDRYFDALQREKLRRNTTLGWLRARFAPRPTD